MARAVILPTPGDPFLLEYWFAMAKKTWLNEVDSLYICLNTPTEPAVVDYIRDTFNHPGVYIKYIADHVQHGDAINAVLDMVTEDYIMLIEDDAFVLKPGAVALNFNLLESDQAAIIGSKRGSSSFEILKKAKEKWGIDWKGEGDQGCNFWPCYFFSHKDVLLNTDRNFNARQWKRGEVIEPLGWTVDVYLVNGDTFVNTSLQIHAMGLNIHWVPQYHAAPEDLDHYDAHYNIFDGKCPWTHIGSLSSGFSGVLMDDRGRPLAKRGRMQENPITVLPKYCNTPAERLEWERRVQLWEMAWEYAKPRNIPAMHELYRHALDRIIVQYKLNKKHILKRKRIYKELGFI